MKKHLRLIKTLLVAAGLCAGSSAWADETATLSPTADTELNWTSDETKSTNYGTETTLNCGIWQEMWTNATPGLKESTARMALLKFDVSEYKGKMTGATLKVTGTNPSSNTAARSIYLGYFTSTSWEETTVTANNAGMTTRAASGLNIQPFSISQSIAKGATTEVSFSNDAFLTYLNNDEDGIVSLIVYGVGQGCYINSKEADSGKPQLVLTYTDETLYSATFTETAGLTPTVTVYTDAERNTEIAYNQLSSNTTYYYRAVLGGYENYEGSFAVESSNPTVSFTMTSLARYTFTVNAVDGSGNIIKALYTDGSSWDGKTQEVTFSKYLTDANNLVTYRKNDATYYTSYTSASGEATRTVVYTAYSGVAYFYEGETFNALGTKVTNGNYSGNRAARGLNNSTLNIMTIPATGTYNLTYAICSFNTNNNVTYSFYKNSSENVIETNEECKWSVNYVKTTGTKTVSNISFAAGDILQFYAGSTNVILDYVLVELTSVNGTLASSGYSSLASAYGLNFAGIDGLTAYVVTDITKDAVKLTSVDELPANSGVILKGTAGAAYSIPVKAGASYNGENKLKAAVTDYNCAANEVYILQSGEFHLVTEASTVPAGKAYLKATDVPNAARSLGFLFGDDEAAGISAVSADRQSSEFYNLQGLRVDAPKKGMYIVNGKKVIIK